MRPFTPIRKITTAAEKRLGPLDTVVVFGELFQRGYANGLVDEALAAQSKVIFSTVGRRDSDQVLRPLTADEVLAKDQDLINVPLEAGFDLERGRGGISPVDQLKDYGLKGWEDAHLNWGEIEVARVRGQRRFEQSCKEYFHELERRLPWNNIERGGRVLFLHTMAGGFPRAKVVMPIANRVFKGAQDRYQSSKVFWDSEIGQLCAQSFEDVTAGTFRSLVEGSRGLRQRIEKLGGQVAYQAFGYHGNEVLIGDSYQWYSYSPYLQGWAKIRLEDHAEDARKNGINATVFNVPEILTNSSSIFLGVEVVLYPLLRAFLKEDPDSPKTKRLLRACEGKLKPGASYQDIDQMTQTYLTDPDVKNWPTFKDWPQHNGPVQMLKMRDTSKSLLDLHKDQKDLMTAELSEVVFKACGTVMNAEAWAEGPAVRWVGHDLVTRATLGSIVP
jgi:hypothetical protein